MGSRVQGAGFLVYGAGSGFEVQCSGSKVQGSRFTTSGFRFGVTIHQSMFFLVSGFAVEFLWFMVHGFSVQI